MVTDPPLFEDILDALASNHWSEVLEGMRAADDWAQQSLPGDSRVDDLVAALVGLARHDKWEIRRAVAQAAGRIQRPALEAALALLVTDENARVNQAAREASLRRRDVRNASVLGIQHETRINTLLDEIQTRFGIPGREAVKRAGEEMANTFARELYHEVIKLVSPLVTTADRIRDHISSGSVKCEILVLEADRLERKVNHLQSVLEAMKAYTSLPSLVFTNEPLIEVLAEAADLARSSDAEGGKPVIEIRVPADISIDAVKSRLIQAFTNLLVNAIEAYGDIDNAEQPVIVDAELHGGSLIVTIRDSGCGMSLEALKDCRTLFSTSKPSGCGFGLPLAIKIVESEHRGRVDIESIEGRGSAVRVILPVQQAS
jgi:signal transduction histidine kinase